MNDVLKSPFVQEMCITTANMYRLGWDERNGGNISLLLDEEELSHYLDFSAEIREIPISFDASWAAGKCFLVTGTGKYFKNIANDPETNLGIIRISTDGIKAELLWGFNDGGSFTSELPSHLLSHKARLKVDPENRVIMHCHPTNIIAMTFIHPLDEREFTRSLWRMITECMMVFPDGVGVLPWQLCGTNEIGIDTARKMEYVRLVIWANHGIYGAGKTLDDAFGLIETVEKAAQIYMMTSHLPRINTITDNQLRQIANKFSPSFREDYLD